MGLEAGDNSLYIVYFAEYQVVVTEDEYDLTYNGWILQKENELTVNFNKCEYIVVGNSECNDLPVC